MSNFEKGELFGNLIVFMSTKLNEIDIFPSNVDQLLAQKVGPVTEVSIFLIFNSQLKEF